MKSVLTGLLFVVVLLTACAKEPDIDAAEIFINASDLEKHVIALASDEFQGRKPFTQGETRTVEYLKNAFEEMGLVGANDGSFFQDVPLVEITGKPSAMTIGYVGGTLELAHMEEFIASTRHITEKISIEKSQLVFAGYGIVAPEYGWNDYEGIDVSGKTVLVLVNDPGYATGDETMFRGKAMTYYGRWTYKYEEAARQGATGVIVIHETGAAGYPWMVLRNGAAGADLVLQAEDNNQSLCALEGWITTKAARKLFLQTGADFKAVSAAAARPGFRAMALNARLNIEINNQIVFNTSKNVMAKIPGTRRKNECVVYTSHWDHLGIGPAVDGDSIYNGAADNAIPLACMLETAKAFTKLDPPPARTILFIAVTAEETGLLGSAYYADHPVIPLEKTVANLNYELFLPLGKMKDVTIYGYGQSELDDYIKDAAAFQGRTVVPEPFPENGMYFRTDHFSFAKKGVPAAFFKGWSEHEQHGGQWTGKQIQDFWNNRYHRPTDEYDPETADLAGIVDDAKLFFRVGVRLATDKSFPRWHESSEFKKIRDKQR